MRLRAFATKGGCMQKSFLLLATAALFYSGNTNSEGPGDVVAQACLTSG